MKDLFRSKMTRIVLWCAGGLLFIVLLLDNVILPWYVNHGGTLVVPDVVGMPEAEAFRLLDSLNLEPRKGDVHPDKDYPEGYVVAQNPVSPQIVKPRRRVYLTISGGEQLAVVPELKGRSLRDTKFALDRSGLKLGTVLRQISKEFPGRNDHLSRRCFRSKSKTRLIYWSNRKHGAIDGQPRRSKYRRQDLSRCAKNPGPKGI